MNLPQVLKLIEADELEALEREAAEKKRLETELIKRLAELGVMAVDGWNITSNFPQSTSVHVGHPGLRNTVTVWLDYDAISHLRCSIVDEDEDNPLVDIVALVKYMDRTTAPPPPPAADKPVQICPFLSMNGIATHLCLESTCAWWVRDNEKYHCAIVDIAKYIADQAGV